MRHADVEIFLADESSPIRAGSKLKGYVLLTVKQGGIKAVDLEMTFRGEEWASVNWQNYAQDANQDFGNNNLDLGVEGEQSAVSSRSLVDTTIPAGDLSFINQRGKVQEGKYQIPFSMDIPDSLPGSLDMTTMPNGECNIKYTLKAVVKGSGNLWNYHKEIPVTVAAKPMDKLPPTPCNASPTSEDVNACCCFGKGQISFGARIDETRLWEEAECTINAALRNYSTAKILNLHARLFQEIKCTADDPLSGSHTAHRRDSPVYLEFPGIVEHAEAQGQVSAAQIQNELQDIFNEIDKGAYQETFSVPQGMLDTYNGPLIQVIHTLELEVKTPSFVSNPTLKIPVLIGQAPDSSSSDTNAAEPYKPPTEDGTVQGPTVNLTEEEIVVDPVADAPPSIEQLTKEMKDSVSDLDLVERKIENPDWASVWKNMSPSQYGSIIKSVSSGFDQPRVGEVLAREIPSFRCEFVASALQSCADFQKTNMVDTLIPYCEDLKENQDVIKQHLTEWEQIVTERAFKNHLPALESKTETAEQHQA